MKRHAHRRGADGNFQTKSISWLINLWAASVDRTHWSTAGFVGKLMHRHFDQGIRFIAVLVAPWEGNVENKMYYYLQIPLFFGPLSPFVI